MKQYIKWKVITNQLRSDCVRIEAGNNNPQMWHGGMEWMVEVSKWLKSGKFDLIVVVKSFDWIPPDVQSSHEEGRCALMVFDWWIEGALWFQTIGYTDPDYWFLPDRWLDMLTCALPCSNELETNLLLYFQNTTPFKRKITKAKTTTKTMKRQWPFDD